MVYAQYKADEPDALQGFLHATEAPDVVKISAEVLSFPIRANRETVRKFITLIAAQAKAATAGDGASRLPANVAPASDQRADGAMSIYAR
jgi:hypothetical protein